MDFGLALVLDVEAGLHWGRKELLFRRCAIRVPLDLCASGTLTRSRSVHCVVSREAPSKRKKKAWAECRADAGIEEPLIEVEAPVGIEAPIAVEAPVEIEPPVHIMVDAAWAEATAVHAAVHATAHAAVLGRTYARKPK
jgi:hypothetical protein